MYQQDPIARGAPSGPRVFSGPSIWFDEFPQAARCRVVTLDPSKGSDARYGDFLGVRDDARRNRQEDLCRRRLDVRNIAIIVETAVELAGRSSPTVRVETKQFQELLAGEMARVGRERGVPMPLYHFDNSVPKIVRIRRLTALLAMDAFRFSRIPAGRTAGAATARLSARRSRRRSRCAGDGDSLAEGLLARPTGRYELIPSWWTHRGRRQ